MSKSIKSGKTLHVGFGNSIIVSKIIAVVNPASSPAKRAITDARASGRLIDATEGRKTKTAIIMEGGIITLSALMPETIIARLEGMDTLTVDKTEV